MERKNKSLFPKKINTFVCGRDHYSVQTNPTRKFSEISIRRNSRMAHLISVGESINGILSLLGVKSLKL